MLRLEHHPSLFVPPAEPIIPSVDRAYCPFYAHGEMSTNDPLLLLFLLFFLGGEFFGHVVSEIEIWIVFSAVGAPLPGRRSVLSCHTGCHKNAEDKLRYFSSVYEARRLAGITLMTTTTVGSNSSSKNRNKSASMTTMI